MRWMKAEIVDSHANCALQCYMFYVFLNFEVCCEITDNIIMLSRHQCLQ